MKTIEWLVVDKHHKQQLLPAYKQTPDNFFIDWANIGAREAQRWFNIDGEEMPENQGIVLVKTDKGCVATAYYHGKESGFITYGEDAYDDFGVIISWRPIERQ